MMRPEMQKEWHTDKERSWLNLLTSEKGGTRVWILLESFKTMILSNQFNFDSVCSFRFNFLSNFKLKVTQNSYKTYKTFRGIINGKAGKHLPYPNFETAVIFITYIHIWPVKISYFCLVRFKSWLRPWIHKI